MIFSPAYRRLLVCFSIAALAACASDSEPPLVGKRVSVLTYGSELVPDADLKKTLLLPEPEPVTEWMQAGGLPHHAMQNPALPAKIIQAWSVSIGSGAGKRNMLLAEPVSQKGIIYTVDAAGLVRAFAVSSGKKLWETLVPQKGAARRISVIGAGLGLDNGMLFVSSGTGEVVALDANNGKEIWRTDLKSPVRSAPAVYGGRLYVITADNKLTALAEDNGRVLWQHFAFLESVSLLGKAAPAIDKGIGVAVFASGEVVGFRPENGSILWTESLGAARMNDAGAEINDIRARPVIAGDRVFVISSGGLLSALDLKTGGIIWEREIGGINQPWLAGDTLYLVSSYAELAAIDVATGKILWVNRLVQWADPEKKKEKLEWTGPVMAGNRLILTNSAGKAIAVSPQTGTIIGWDDIDESGTLPPIVVDDTLFFITQNGKLVAYR